MNNRIGLVLGLGLTLCAGVASGGWLLQSRPGNRELWLGRFDGSASGQRLGGVFESADLAGLEGFDFMVGQTMPSIIEVMRALRRLSTQRDQTKSPILIK